MSAASRPKLRVHCFAISIDGYGAGPSQDLENPLGIGGLALHEWVFATRTFQKMIGRDGGTTGIDDAFAARARVSMCRSSVFVAPNTYPRRTPRTSSLRSRRSASRPPIGGDEHLASANGAIEPRHDGTMDSRCPAR
jgi:hypothetical protein